MIRQPVMREPVMREPVMPEPEVPEPRDRGAAMIMTLMVLALVTALSTTVAVVTISSLQGARRAEQAGVVLNAAEAGASQALSYMRANGVRDLRCQGTGTGCDKPYGSTNPVQATLPQLDGASYSVWVEQVQAIAPRGQVVGVYEIHSTGRTGSDAERTIVVRAEVEHAQVPRGIFARSVSGGGNARVVDQSVFSTGCVYRRSQLNVEGVDAAYGMPAGVHSSEIITDANDGGRKSCLESDRKSIHFHGPCPDDPALRYDQDKMGGSLAGEPGCAVTDPDLQEYYGAADPSPALDPVFGSFIKDDAALLSTYGFKDPALTQAQTDRLRAMAEEQGTLFTTADGANNLPSNPGHMVLYFDLTDAPTSGHQRVVSLDDIEALEHDTTCQTGSRVIVVEDGNVDMNSNAQMSAAVFLVSKGIYGHVLKANGTADMWGTVYADSIDLTGTVDLRMDDCFLNNVSPALLEIEVKSYLEDDAG